METATNTQVQVPPKPSLVARLGARYGVEPDKLLATLKATAFRGREDRKTGQMRVPTNEEMMALLVVADQYGLNPFTRELYAFLDPKSGAIVPIVSVDGWLRIINERPELRGIAFTQSSETLEHKGHTVHVWLECELLRSDRVRPVVIREYFGEVVRSPDYVTPWDTHPNRMHRHKTLIQCARVAFGFGGIYDEDEGRRIIEGEVVPRREVAAIVAINQAVGEPTSPDKPVVEPVTFSYAQLSDQMAKATTLTELDLAESLIDKAIADPLQREELHAIAEFKREELKGEKPKGKGKPLTGEGKAE